jgi:hypothetical protein
VLLYGIVIIIKVKFTKNSYALLYAHFTLLILIINETVGFYSLSMAIVMKNWDANIGLKRCEIRSVTS